MDDLLITILVLSVVISSLCAALVCQFGLDQVSGIECGTVNTIIPLIVGGNRIQRGAWPFLVAVYDVTESKFICGGTLISNKQVLTAAHCVHGKYSIKKLMPQDITVYLGAYNLTDKNEVAALQRNVTQIYVHPDWKIWEVEYDADLAILLLSDNVEFTNHIRPVCLPAEDDIFENASGYVAGWGLTGNDTAFHKEFPNVGATYALNASYCYPTDKSIDTFSSPRTFCGGGGKGSPNEGDSGGGFFVLSRAAWVQYGVVSAIHPHSDGRIDENSFAIYQNVKLYKDWIVETTNMSDGRVMTVGEGTSMKLERQEMPFLAKIYHVKDNKFLCSGTLISSSHVLTAAHCIQGKYSSLKLEPHEIVVHLEVFNLTTNSNTFALKSIAQLERNISEIYIHPDWVVDHDRYDADLAILLLSDNVTDNLFRPVCMPANDFDADIMDDVRGTAISWISSEEQPHESRDFPRPIIVNTLKQSYCFREEMYTAAISTKRTFCGRGEKESLNKGDGGCGLFVHSGSTWILYGIVSAMRANATGHIQPWSMIILQNVKLHKAWIIETVDQSRDAVIPMCEAKEIKINFYCEYTDYGPYACVLRDVDVSYGHLDVAPFMGTHLPGKTADDVEEIRFYNGRMLHIPNKIGIYFQNLKYFSVRSKMSLKLLRPSNFRNLENLIDVEIGANDIHSFQKETLWELPNLERFFLTYNNLAILYEGTFEKNLKLREVYLRSNKLEFLPRNLFASNSLLETVNFDDNALSVIETTFTNIKSISLLHNICINTFYDETDHKHHRNFIRNFTEFQSLLISKCSSLDPSQIPFPSSPLSIFQNL